MLVLAGLLSAGACQSAQYSRQLVTPDELLIEIARIRSETRNEYMAQLDQGAISARERESVEKVWPFARAIGSAIRFGALSERISGQPGDIVAEAFFLAHEDRRLDVLRLARFAYPESVQHLPLLFYAISCEQDPRLRFVAAQALSEEGGCPMNMPCDCVELSFGAFASTQKELEREWAVYYFERFLIESRGYSLPGTAVEDRIQISPVVFAWATELVRDYISTHPVRENMSKEVATGAQIEWPYVDIMRRPPNVVMDWWWDKQNRGLASVDAASCRAIAKQ
jgi:hypothetical protein